MNPEEKERILNLVKQGMLTSEEATILLENRLTGKNDESATQEAYNKSQAAAESDNKDSQAKTTEDDEALKNFYEEMANQANQNATWRDQKYAVQKDLEKELAEKLAAKRELTALDAAEVISPANEMKLIRLNEEIEQLTGQLTLIKEEIAELDRLLKREKQQRKQQTDTGNTAEPSEDSEEQSIREKLTEAASAVSKTLGGLFTLEKTKHGLPLPQLVQRDYDKELVYANSKASVFNIKISRGNVTFKVWERNDLVIAVEGRIYGNFDEASTLEAFRQRANIEVTDDEVNVQVNNHFITSNIEFFVPRQTFDYIQLNSLSGNIVMTGVDSNDIYIHTIDGDISLDDVRASMIELDTKNGNMTMTNITAKDLSATTLNGNHRLTGDIKHTKLRSLNGAIRVTYLNSNLNRAWLESKNGDIKVNMPQETSLHGRAQTNTGNIMFRHEELDIDMVRDEQLIQVQEFHYQGKSEPFNLNVTTVAGNIRIKADVHSTHSSGDNQQKEEK